MQRNGPLLPLRGCRQVIAARGFLLVWLLSLGCAADPTWDLIQQGRPGLARQRLKQPSLLQSAQLAQAEGQVGEAWRFLRQLEPTYKPGQQPAEFFWLRAQLLRDSQWNLTAQNLRGVLAKTPAPELRLLALTTQALAQEQQEQTSKAGEAWLQLAHAASEMKPQHGPWVLHLALAQASRQLLADRPDQALITLVNARALAQSERLPALLALVQLKVAEVEGELADWPAFADNCQAALQTARQLSEPWLVERICTFWVDQQLLRSSDQVSARRCLKALQSSESWFQGPSRLVLLSQLARLQALGLNQRTAGLATLDRAIELCPANKLEVRLLAERFVLTPTSEKDLRRRLLLQTQADLNRLGVLQPEDLVAQKLPPYGIWAAMADTYLPEQPDKAEEFFAKALSLSPDRTAKLRVLSYQMQRSVQMGAQPAARQSLKQLLETLRAAPLDPPALAVVREQIVDLNGGSRHLGRLLLTDDIHAPAESATMLFLHQLLAEGDLQTRLDRDIYQQIRLARGPQDACRAYLARTQLLMAQNRGPEAALAAEKMAELAHKGELPQQEAQAYRLLAELRWSFGLDSRALEACQQAETLYAASASAQDQLEGQNCKLLRAYFLMRTQRAGEALQICQHNQGPWFAFLGGRCQLELGHRQEAEAAFAGCTLPDELAEVGRLVFQARASDQPEPLYQQAYDRAARASSLIVREICLDWAAYLRRSGKTEQALKLEDETRRRLTELFSQYPAEVRERLLDQPLTQKLFPSTRSAQVVDPRQTRRDFLASLNEVRQRYPRMDNELAISPSDLVALQESIPADRVLVQYFAGEADLYAMRVDRQGCRLLQLAVEKSVLQGWIHEVRQALSQRKPLPEQSARRLYLTLVAPLGEDLKDKQIQVIPGGSFWYLPWDVLKDPQGHYLVESLNWSCVSPSELLRSRFPAAADAGAIEHLVALGGSNPELPATGEEALMVAALFPHSETLIGPQARSSELIRLAPQAEILHVASHSGLSPSLNQTYIELSDGPFTLEQVYGLQLRPSCRVVLSSCESALGQADPGREVSSLATAFLVGGATSVVATLWRVEDNTSKAFFQRFYPRLLQLGSTSKALRQARLDCLADPALSAPWGWGAYQLIGQP